MKVARVFRLDKLYPGSPGLGEKVVETFTTNNKCNGFILLSSISSPNLIKLKEDQIENFPEFWKPCI